MLSFIWSAMVEVSFKIFVKQDGVVPLGFLDLKCTTSLYYRSYQLHKTDHRYGQSVAGRIGKIVPLNERYSTIASSTERTNVPSRVPRRISALLR